MIVDCHTHIWQSPDQLGMVRKEDRQRVYRGADGRQTDPGLPDASTERHIQESAPVDLSFVFGFKSRYLAAEIPSEFIAGYVRQHPEKLIGVAGIDPTNQADALEDIRTAKEQLGLKGITVSPAAQDFHPADSRAMQVYAEAARLGMPVFLHQGIHYSVQTKLEFARPVMLDEVAREFPNLRLVVAHMGYPWVDECIVLLGKHPHVYADISALMHRPWQAYSALMAAYQYGVIDKLLFGSDFPFTSATSAIESLYRINQIATGTNLPTVPRPQLAAIVERDAMALLGLSGMATPRRTDDDDASLLDMNDDDA